MPVILLTNDDGVGSRALVPLARALGTIAEVRVVVPDRERSWVSKAMTTTAELAASTVVEGGIEMVTVDGYPADCVQLGVFNIFEDPPDLVVSGINIGANYGQAYVASSGTVGAGIEAALSGIPVVVLSAAADGEWLPWSAWARTADADDMWERLGGVASDLVSGVFEHGFPADIDVLKVELPAGADLETPRRMTAAAPVRYGALFETTAPGRFRRAAQSDLHPSGPVEGTDLGVVNGGEIAITALRFDALSRVPQSYPGWLERS